MNLHEYAVFLGITDPDVHWFDEFVERLTTYKEKYGSGLVPLSYACPDGYKLGGQVHNIRQNHKEFKSLHITPWMISKLDTLGFVWEVGYRKWFPEFLDHMREYRGSMGIVWFPARTPVGMGTNSESN